MMGRLVRGDVRIFGGVCGTIEGIMGLRDDDGFDVGALEQVVEVLVRVLAVEIDVGEVRRDGLCRGERARVDCFQAQERRREDGRQMLFFDEDAASHEGDAGCHCVG